MPAPTDRANAVTLHVYSSVSDGRAELSRWSDHHHLESLTRPGWLSVRRFELEPIGPTAGQAAFDILTAFELESLEAAELIRDRSFTPTPLPPTVIGLQSARAVLRPMTPGSEGSDDPSPAGEVLVQATLDFSAEDSSALQQWTQAWPTGLRHGPTLARFRRLLGLETSLTTLFPPPRTVRVIEQYELAAGDDAPALVASLGRAAQEGPAAHSDVLAYRQVYPSQEAAS